MALVEIGRFYNSMEAGLAQSRLEADGIPSFLFDLQMTWEGAGLAIPIRLMVDDEDEVLARDALQGPDPEA
jgi:hypothetical protein